MKLRYSPTSPFVRKVMVVALETGLAERIERIPTSVAPTKPNDEVARENPLVKVPALTTDDGLVLYDSPVICEYLDTLHDRAQALSRRPARRAGSRCGSRRSATACSRRRSSGATRRCGPRSSCGRTGSTPSCARCAARSRRSSSRSRPASWAPAAIAPTIGHITIGCALGYLDFRYQSEDWRARSRRLAAWYETFAARKSMQLTVPKA